MEAFAISLLQLERTRIGQRPQAALPDQHLVDAADPASVGRVDGNAECCSLAIHRSARRDDQVGERDQALGVDGSVRDDHGREGELPDVVTLLGAAREDHRLDGLLVAEMSEQLREERVRAPVVERHVGRRPHDDERALPVDQQLGEDALIRLEVVEVVLLLQARVLEELRWPDAEASHALEWDRVGDDDLRRGAIAQMVLERRVLVVVRRRARDAQSPGGDRQLVGAVREREVVAAALGVSLQGSQPAGERGRLAHTGAAAVAPDHFGLDPVPLEELERLRVVASGDLDLVAALFEEPDQGPEHQHMSRGGDVDPDLHLASLAGDGSRPAEPASAAAWRRWRHGALRPRASRHCSLRRRTASDAPGNRRTFTPELRKGSSR